MSKVSAALISTPTKAVSSLAATLSKPATPTTEIPPSPGTFRHPRLTEIIQRQAAVTITSQKIQKAIINIMALVATFVFHNTLEKWVNTCLALVSIPPSAFDASAVTHLLRILFCANTFLCLRPVLPYISPPDTVTDIPLTPSQRALLGLPTSGQGSPAPTAASAAYVTPPRYRRDGGINGPAMTPNSPLAFSTGRRSTSANHSFSPRGTSRQALGFSPSPQQKPSRLGRTYQPTSDSTFAESPGGSPSFHLAGTNDSMQSSVATTEGYTSLGTNTSSFGFGLSRSQSLRERHGRSQDLDNLPGTPSPSAPKRQPGVNYKWLYEKGARLPRSESTGF